VTLAHLVLFYKRSASNFISYFSFACLPHRAGQAPESSPAHAGLTALLPHMLQVSRPDSYRDARPRAITPN
jgi:hypothetical protein